MIFLSKTNGVLPEIKKKLSAFLKEEDGRITKENLVATGAALVALSGMLNAACTSHNQNTSHTDSSTMAYNTGTRVITATHSHYDPAHCNHSSHSSHGSHGSHSSDGS